MLVSRAPLLPPGTLNHITKIPAQNSDGIHNFLAPGLLIKRNGVIRAFLQAFFFLLVLGIALPGTASADPQSECESMTLLADAPSSAVTASFRSDAPSWPSRTDATPLFRPVEPEDLTPVTPTTITSIPVEHHLDIPYRSDGVRPVVDRTKLTQLVPDLLQKAGYTDIRLLAKGGMGSVFLVTSNGQRKVIKILQRPEALHVDTFNHEAAVMNRLSEVDRRFATAKRIDFVSSNGQRVPAIEMDFITKHPGSDVAAESLATLLKDPKFWQDNPGVHAEIRAQFTELLYKAHRAGIWHLDIKPANILVTFDSDGRVQVRLVDWGLSHQDENSGALQSPLIGRGHNLIGTPGYFPAKRYNGSLPEKADDVYAARIVDWKLRQITHNTPEYYVVRTLGPAQTPTAARDSEESSGGTADTSGFKNTFKEPAFALDLEGKLADRILAMAEWSQLPSSIPARERLLARARRMTPENFLKHYGQELGRLQDEFHDAKFRHRLALEILGSTVLIDHLDTNSGLHLSKENIDGLARSAAKYYVEARSGGQNPSSYNIFSGPHGDYHFERLAKRIDALAAEGKTKPWQEWITAEGGPRPGP